VLEVPIAFTQRATGVSKMNKQIVAEALWRVTVWALTGRRRRARRLHPGSVVDSRSMP
jgi:dolichol-phosphate mannosyltransferase